MLETMSQRKSFRASVENSRQKLMQYRQNRTAFLKEMAGRWWGAIPVDGQFQPLQLMTHAVETMVRALVASNPQVSITTMHKQLRAMAADAEVIINAGLAEHCVERQLTRWVRDAMFGPGILQIGLEPDGFYQDPQTGEFLAQGKVVIDNVSLDDFVCDMSAKSLDPRHCQFYGHLFEQDLEDARSDPRYDETARLNLVESPSSDNSDGAMKSSSLGAENVSPPSPKVRLWQFFFPQHKKIVILPESFSDEAPPLAIEDWNGPAFGPYHFLKFIEIPDNVMPLPMAAVIMDLSQIANSVMAKEAFSTINAKDLLTYREGHAKDAEAVVGAGHMEAIALENPDSVRPMRLNGPRAENMGFLAQAMTAWNMMSGNVNLVAGLGTKSPTLGQDQLLAEASNQQLGYMRQVVLSGVKDVLSHWAWHYWNDPFRVDRNVRQVPNTTFTVPVLVTPEQRKNTWARMNMHVQPYSLRMRSPEQRLAELDQVIGMLVPMAQILASQGLMIDWQQYLQLRAKYTGSFELLDIVRPQNGEWPSDGPIGQRGTMPATRFGQRGPRGVYRHISESNRTFEDDFQEGAAMAAKGDSYGE